MKKYQNTIKRFKDYQDFKFIYKSWLSCNQKNHVQTISENFKELAI